MEGFIFDDCKEEEKPNKEKMEQRAKEENITIAVEGVIKDNLNKEAVSSNINHPKNKTNIIPAFEGTSSGSSSEDSFFSNTSSSSLSNVLEDSNTTTKEKGKPISPSSIEGSCKVMPKSVTKKPRGKANKKTITQLLKQTENLLKKCQSAGVKKPTPKRRKNKTTTTPKKRKTNPSSKPTQK
jgi:hypothetical protein